MVLALPTTLLVVLALIGVVGQFHTANDAAVTVREVDLVLGSQELVHSLQRERGLSNGLLGGASGYRAALDTQRRVSDSSRTALDRELAGSQAGRSAGAVRAALSKLADLGTVRGSVDAARIDRPQLLAFYTAAINALNDATAGTQAGQQDAAMRQGLQALQQLGQAKEATALERGQLNGVFAAGAFTPADYIAFTEVRARRLDALTAFARVATARRANDLAAAQRTTQATLAANYEQHALDGASGKPLHLSPETWWAAMTRVVDDLHTVQRGIGGDVQARAKQIRGDALRMLAAYSAAAALALLFALLLLLYTFRSIMRPLRALTGEARDAATKRLPGAVAAIQAAEDPHAVIVARSRSSLIAHHDEFSEVAGALDELQATAVRLAVEQAVMRRNTAESLANLGRRNQNLVRRQLGFITSLEKEESDPNQLANLFELDHLATRMRRNAESLLVLVGEHSPRRWSGAVEVGDVLRSAFAEVEDYRRVVLRRMDEAPVRGDAAAEISHLLAELLENALTFSPPDREVEVQARMTGEEYHIAIVDQGIGLSPQAMAMANARLRGEESFLVAPTRNLGHYVVGRLAERLGIRVWLHDSPLNGVTARVVLPGGLIVAPERADPPRPAPAPAVAAVGAGQGTAVAIAAPPASNPPAGPGGSAPPAWPPRAEPADSTGTTRNGLVKRQGRRAQTTPRPAAPAGAPAVPERSPAEVRSMLESFRGGVHRAEQRRTDGRQ